MGTVFSLDVRAPGCDPDAVEDVFRWLHWVDKVFSTYDRDSQISRLARGELSQGECASEVGEILTRSAELEVETSGYFSAHASGRLDPSGLVKGWAIQRASERLASAGSANHCLNGGGDVQCLGLARPGSPWRVGVADPLDPARLAAVISGRAASPADGLAVATSGTAERGAHIIDPTDGSRPTALASVTLVGRDLSTTDAYATAAFAMGPAAPAWIEGLEGYHGFVVFADGSQWRSSAFADGRTTLRR
ncbi:MAG: thiamine biosynthesis protein [Frankiales bacterium]|nr:thiamine biosynthesis protein [Frankiales bacterium]